MNDESPNAPLSPGSSSDDRENSEDRQRGNDRSDLPDATSEPTSVHPQSAPSAEETDVANAPSTDVRLASLPTGVAPSLPATINTPARPQWQGPVVPTFSAGVTIEDYEIMGLLGRGAFAAVYRAKQKSLEREVALKVSLNRGSEGRTLARLEHPHIVQVFTESPDSTAAYRLLCMQIVPGCSLDRVIATLKENDGHDGNWNGEQFLAAVASNTKIPVAFDPAALADRESVNSLDAVEATSWLGVRLADALDYAHAKDVLHRDIKPANILVSPYGRPYLADFNIAHRGSESGDQPSEEETFGGTLHYMSPEHLDAFHPHTSVDSDAVTPQSDIYSLGIVLCELNSLRSPFPPNTLPDNLIARVESLTTQRKEFRLPIPSGPTSPEKLLTRTLSQCLAATPSQRPDSGAKLAARLSGLQEYCQAIRRLPAHRRFAGNLLRSPFLFMILFAVLPHLAGSIVNIAYNHEQIVRSLTPGQHTWFFRSVALYNSIVYPIAILIACRMLIPVYRTWSRLNGCEPISADEVDKARTHVLTLPVWYALIAVFGWFPGGLLFPLAIDQLAEPLPLTVWLHFVASFTLSGLIALAYSYAGVQFITLRVLYPQFWVDPSRFREVAKQELAAMPERHRLLTVLSGSIPLLSAILLLVVDSAEEGFAFRLVIISLIFLGMFGYQVASAGADRLSRAVTALTTT